MFQSKKLQKSVFDFYYLVQVDCYYLVQVECVLKNALARNFLFQKKRVEAPIFIVFFFDNRCFIKNKLGPDNNFQKGQTWTRQ